MYQKIEAAFLIGLIWGASVYLAAHILVAAERNHELATKQTEAIGMECQRIAGNGGTSHGE